MPVAEIIKHDKTCWNENIGEQNYDLGKRTSRNIKIHYLAKPKRKHLSGEWGFSKNHSEVVKNNLMPIEKKFQELSNKWKNETKGFSLAASKINNTNYLTIIGLGVTFPDKITKLILKDLEQSSSYWHYALKKITNINPVPKEFSANTKKTRDFWLKWANENNKF